MSIVQYEAPPPLPPSKPGEELEQGPRGWVARLRAAAEIANHIAPTEFVPVALRDNPPAIAAAILYGQEIGLEPMQALAKIAVIKGRPTLTAEAQRSLILAAGHELWFEESTVTRAIVAGRRAGTDRIGRITWTMDDAKRAGLAGQPNFRAYPAEMLRARASAALSRAMFADVIGGLVAAEELDDETGNGPAPGLDTPPPPDDAPPAPPASRTRRRPKPAPAAPAPEPERPPVPPTPPPDTQPEPPAEPDPANEPPATDGQKRQLFALMRDVGLATADRDARLSYTEHIVGRELESSNDLTIREAGLVIDDLVEVKALPAAERAARLGGDVAAPVPADPPPDPQAAPARDEPVAAADAPEGDEPTPVPYNEFPEGF